MIRPFSLRPAFLLRAALALVLGSACLGPARVMAEDLPQGLGLSNPSLAFGLTGISDFSTEMPFLDLMKQSRPWVGHSQGKWGAMRNPELVAGGYLDAAGWVKQIPPGLDAVGTIWAWGNTKANPGALAGRAGRYVVTFEGTGTIEITGDVKVLGSQRGRIEFENLHGGTMGLDITATDPGRSGDYIRNITVVRRKYQDLLAAGEPFNPDWLAVVGDARVLRFMDWMTTNSRTNPTGWADRPQPGDATYMTQGAPVEVMVQLANQTGAEPWFNMPTGASADYIRQFATYVRDHLAPGLVAHVEYSNEAWNGALPAYKQMVAGSQAAWGVSAPADYYAMQVVRMGQIWKQVFGPEAAARLDIVMGTQTGNPWVAKEELSAPIWKAHDPAGHVAPASVVTSLAVTTYFGGLTVVKPDLRAELLHQIQTGTPADATAWLAARLQDPAYPGSLAKTEALLAANKAVAEAYGVKLVAYEGGQHVQQSFAVHGISKEDLTSLTDFLTGFVRSPAMADLYTWLWAAWAKVGDGPFMQFGDVAAPSKYGSWGLLSALGDSNPRATALFALNARTPAWFAPGGPQYQQGVIRLGEDGANRLTGTMKDDVLIGGPGDDTFIPGTGHDRIHGGPGANTLVLPGAPGDYTLVAAGKGYRLTGPQIADDLFHIQTFRFDGGVTEPLEQMLKH